MEMALHIAMSQKRRLTRARTSSSSFPTLLVSFAPPEIGFPSLIQLINNLGYSRIVLAIASLYYMPLHPRTCSLLYSISCLLDALDGFAARHFEQSTRFGAVLDMVTDRCTTACLLVFLASAFPRWSLVFQGLISLDLASHYMHMYATLVMGGGESHKKVDKSRSWILNLYYTNKVAFPSRNQSRTGKLTPSFSRPYYSSFAPSTKSSS